MANALDTGSLSYAQLKGVWLSASRGTRYHTNAWASLMAAIAEAESSGNPLATNPYDNNGSQTSWGLWQISNGTHDAPASDWANPDANAQLAIGKLDSQGLDAWGTYQSGAYQAYLSDKTTADLTAFNGPDSVTQAGATAAAEAGQTCAWSIGGGTADFIIYHQTLPSYCIVQKSQVRALVGVALLFIGAGIMAGAMMGLAGGKIAVLAGLVPGAKKSAGVAGAAEGETAAAPAAELAAA
jgi:hypothetical protein